MSSLNKELIDLLQSNLKPTYFNTTKTEFRIRCPYCGDSIKSEKSAHLYIDITKENIFPYYCQRCSASGIVNPKFINDLGIYEFKVSSKLHSSNKNYKPIYKRYKNNIVRSIQKDLIVPEYNDKYRKKLDYICNRLNINFDPIYLTNNYYIIWNHDEFIKVNNIKENISAKFHNYLTDSFIGFLSYDEGHIIYRNIDNNNDMRYHVYCMNIESNKYFIPKIDVDILTPKLNVILTEGIFDIISIKENFYKDKLDNRDIIFLSVNGKGYGSAIMYLARLGFINMNIHIYSDKDVNMYYYNNLSKYNVVMRNNDIYIYYNKLGKDYGVPKDKIDLSYAILR